MSHRLFRPLTLALAVLLALTVALPGRAAGPLAGQIICLDPGHGGLDPGAYNATHDLRESEINLDVAHALSGLLNGAGATVLMTRTGNQAKTESDRAAFCNQAAADLLVSIHTNSVADANPNGTLVYYYKTTDTALAQALHDELLASLQPTAAAPASFTDFGVRRFRAGVLRRSAMAAALVEPAFLSAPAEAKLLATPIFTAVGSGIPAAGCPAFNCRRGQITQALYRGILAYFEAG